MSPVLPRLRRIASRTVRQPRLAFTEARLRLFTFMILARDPEAYQFVASWAYGSAPRVPIQDLFPNIETAGVEIQRAFDRDIVTSITAKELLVLCAIVRHAAPQQILEIGTFDGNTTLNLIANAPADGRITTVDLPADWDGVPTLSIPCDRINATSPDSTGHQFHDAPNRNRIQQVYADSANLDWNTLGGPFDLVFIDGCHEYNYVRHDTLNALKQIRPGGLIVWHDYGNFEGVSRAVDEFAIELAVSVVQGTRLAIGFAPQTSNGSESMATTLRQQGNGQFV